MQVGRVVDLKNCGKYFDFLRRNNVLIVLVVFFLFGLGFGIFSFKGFSDFKAAAQTYLESFVDLRTDSGFLKITVNSFLVSLTYIVLCFIAGSSALGIVVLPFVVALRGAVYGALMALLYSEYALKGIAFNAVMVLPAAAIFTAALILAARESVGFSLRVARLTLPRTSPSNLYYDFKNYCGRYLVICLLVLVSALADGLISRYFSDSFSL